MTILEIIDYCKTYPSAYVDYPFDGETPVMRHGGNKKIFALFGERNDKPFVNLKCDPMEAEFLRTVYTDITAGYHMNKTHWNTVYINGDVPDEKLYELIGHSFDLTKPKKSKNVNKD